ncbi:DedA family protein [Kangiella aquimarina]|uniref:DedA family protein n=1 Tax=Kangiella aquimarina TaxID=261965 RepID=A0ABZ0X495_9GAMM|nr:DedA family protein [Kangiella aquimarina]WQG85350.1 DedA family protein [Kangiella aquimarina]
MEAIVNDILDWISNHPHLAGAAVFLIAFLESLAIVGLAVPGWLLLVGVGSLIGGGTLNFWLVAFCSFLGAASGQIVSYWFGYHFQDKVHHWGWIQRHQKMLHTAEDFFQRHGFAGVLVGQFIGPIRAVIALIAGVLDMPPKKFITAIVIATVIWAPVYLMPGVVLGAALTFEKTQVWVLVGSLVIMAICLWLLGRFMIDHHRARKHHTTLSLKRHINNLLALGVFSGVIVFLIVSSYGSLMLQLASKIWNLII